MAERTWIDAGAELASSASTWITANLPAHGSHHSLLDGQGRYEDDSSTYVTRADIKAFSVGLGKSLAEVVCEFHKRTIQSVEQRLDEMREKLASDSPNQRTEATDNVKEASSAGSLRTKARKSRRTRAKSKHVFSRSQLLSLMPMHTSTTQTIKVEVAQRITELEDTVCCLSSSVSACFSYLDFWTVGASSIYEPMAYGLPAVTLARECSAARRIQLYWRKQQKKAVDPDEFANAPSMNEKGVPARDGVRRGASDAPASILAGKPPTNALAVIPEKCSQRAGCQMGPTEKKVVC